MLTKFESKSARVKGLAFHPVRPWICASLHNGAIQLWDYRVGTVIDKFEEHDGPVRGIDFHPTESLLASGGDDYKIKVWDYKLRRCLFTLLGHLDYIRTVQFHSQHPWLLSASDDQTLRLWNHELRSCLSVLTGHNHYVMCAAFHPTEDLIVSASLDQTVRVWDTTGLRKKHTGEAQSDMMDGIPGGGGGMGGLGGNGGVGVGGSAAMNVQAELFGTNDVVVKYVLEGHDRGVNWAAFHPTLPLIASAADDRLVKLWRMSDSKAWEVDTLRGHANNVSCCLFHPKHELIISNSEDRSIRVWDVSKRVGVQTFRREGDRFWIFATHRNQNLLAAGHDSGLIVFKLERERPASCIAGDRHLYYVRGRELYRHDSTKRVDVPLASLRRIGQQAQTDGIGSAPRYLSYNHHNPNEGNVLVGSDVDGGSYELLTFPLEGKSGSVTDGARGSCMGPAVFLGTQRFAVLDKHQRQIVVKNLRNETTKRVPPPVPAVDGLLEGGASGRLLLKSEDRVLLFEVQSRRVLGDLHAPKLKMAVWSPDGSAVALICKFCVVLADRTLQNSCNVVDTVRIKSGAWERSSQSQLFFYTTSVHVKYALYPSGDTGTLRTLDAPLYATRADGDSLECLDREARVRRISVDAAEARFKLALRRGDTPSVVSALKSGSRLCGRAIVGYLQSVGYPEVALHFVKRDPHTRFQLALACGNLEAAMESAFELNEVLDNSINGADGGGDADDKRRKVWGALGGEALRQGNHEVVEMSYQRTKDFDRLSFLYTITGNTDKLRKMLKIAHTRRDIMGRYHNALYLGDAKERVSVLEETGNLNLAYVSATLHGLTEDAERIKVAIETNGGSVEGLMDKLPGDGPKNSGCLLQPPTPIVRAQNWPTLEVPKTSLENLSLTEQAPRPSSEPVEEAPMDDTWNDSEAKVPETAELAEADDGMDDDDDMGWGDDDEDDFGDLLDPEEEKAETKNGDDGDMLPDVSDAAVDSFRMPAAGRPPAGVWVSSSSHAADHMAAGAATSALQLLNRQIAASNLQGMRPYLVKNYLACGASLPGLFGTNSHVLALSRNDRVGEESLPRVPTTVAGLQAVVRQGYRAFQSGKFSDAKSIFGDLLFRIPLVVTTDPTQKSQALEMVEVSREYIIAIRIKAAMAEQASNPVRSTELSAYFTHCNLQPTHLMLALRSAMGTSFKHKNYILSGGFARRLLELPDLSGGRNADLRSKATKVLQKSEQMARNEFQDINYDEKVAFVVDSKNLVPIPVSETSGSGGDLGPVIQCPYCRSYYRSSDMSGKVCLNCNLCVLGGLDTIGLVTGS